MHRVNGALEQADLTAETFQPHRLVLVCSSVHERTLIVAAIETNLSWFWKPRELHVVPHRPHLQSHRAPTLELDRADEDPQ